MSSRPLPLLRYALIGDAVASGATGLLMFAGAGFLTAWLGLPETLLRYAGLVLLPYAALVGHLGTRNAPARPAVWAIILANAMWVIDSLVMLASGWVAPTALGTAFVLLQALVVAGFAGAQYLGLRQATGRAAVTA